MPLVLEQDEPTFRATSPPFCLKSRRTFGRYCVLIALAPIVTLSSSFFIARSFWYIRHQRNSYLAISDYPFTLADKHFDVVIYGDSSALTGISPQVIDTATGMRSVNIAEPNTALEITGTFALDSYLRRNARPRIVVIQFIGPDFALRNEVSHVYGEGALQLVRHKLDNKLLALIAMHPIETLEFSESILRATLVEEDWAGTTYNREWSAIQETRGFFTAPRPPLKSCTASLEKKLPDAAWIKHLRDVYSEEGTNVLIYVAPVPQCEPTARYYAEELNGLADNRLETYDVGLFNETNHFTLEGANRNSLRIAADIKSRLGIE